MHEELKQDWNEFEELDARVIRALERAPQPVVPPDFAARIAGMVPVRKAPASLKPTHYGRNAMAIGMLVAFVGLLALATHSSAKSPVWLTIEWLLCAQVMALGVWWGFRHWETQ